MKTSERGIKLIKQFEGCRLQAYRCPAGVLTIGYGHTSGVSEGMKITQQQADNLLKDDLAKYEAKVNAYDSIYHWSQCEFDALVSFCYNIGNINQLTNNGKRTRDQIIQHITDYVHASGKVLNGLVRRRAAEKELFLASDTIEETNSYPEYVVGKTYKLQVALKVRKGASDQAELVGYKNLTASAKKHDKDKNGSLEAGTRVTCKALVHEGNNIWMLIPSGFIAAYYQGKEYVK